MSTQLLLGVAGATVGFFAGGIVGAQIGFLAGSLIGSLIDRPKQEGPRVTDLKVQVSSYGKMIPIFWGTGRIAGNVIDNTDLEEHEQKSGGKGGPQVINFTYSMSLMIQLGAARRFGEDVIVGCLRTWADGRLTWDVNSGETCPFTIYKGGQDQIVDPTFEAIHGVGEVPAYRGQALAVAADMYMTDFGNRMPQWEFDVFTGGGSIPWRVSTFDAWPGGNMFNWSATYSDGVITTYWADNIGPNRYIAQYDIYGNIIAGPVTSPNTGWTPVVSGWIEQSPWAICYVNTGSGSEYYWFKPSLTGPTIQGNRTGVTGPLFYGNPGCMNYSKTYAFGVSNGATTIVHRWAVDADLQPSEADPTPTFALDALYSPSNIEFGNSFDNPDEIWVMVHNPGPTAKMWRLDQEFNLIHFWDTADMAGCRIPDAYAVAGGPFYVYQGRLCFNNSTGPSTKVIDLVTIDPATQVLTDYAEGSRLAHQGLVLPAILALGNGLCIDFTGVFSLDPPPESILLSQIVADISDMTPIAGAYDVSELTDEVRWFSMAQPMTARNAIQSLRQCFFFDATEEDDAIKFYKRDLTGSPARTIYSIPDDDLNARSEGNESGDLVTIHRKREQELPRTVSLNYIDVDHDYQIGTQSSPRQTTLSQQDTTIDVPVGLTANEALAKCWTLQTSEWVERETFEFSTTRKWAKLGPCSIVEIQGRVIRILTRSEQPDGVINFTGVLAAPSTYITPASSLYYQPAPGAPSDGFVPPTPPLAKVETRLIMLDIPLVTDTDSPNGYYAAMGPNGSGSWTGAELFKSSDGGSTYASIGSTIVEDTIGDVALALGDFGGGNIFDESNVITVVLTSGSLSSSSELGVLNGANLCAIGSASGGWELLQFKTATLIATDTYMLSGLLRGRRGTEWIMPLHGTSEEFVLLPSAVNVAGPFAEIGLARLFKAVSYGLTVASATALTFTNNAVALKCYAPVQIGGGWANGDVTLNWARRTRIAGAWLDNIDVPLSETTEQYAINIYTDNTYATFVVTAFATSQTLTITNAELTSVFGSPPPNEITGIYGDVAQLGSYGYGYATRFHV